MKNNENRKTYKVTIYADVHLLSLTPEQVKFAEWFRKHDADIEIKEYNEAKVEVI